MSSLERFGFTPTETRVYEVLLRVGASTGYSVAREAGLARANTYQALDGLVRRGAARRSATTPARYAALPPQAVIDSLGRGIQRDLEALQESLRSLPRSTSGEPALLIAHDDWRTFESGACRTIGQAREEVLAVAGPWAATVLDALAAARARGVAVRAVSLGTPAPAGFTMRSVPEDDLVAYWSGKPVAIVVDRAIAWCGIHREGGGGVESTHSALVPFIRHLLRRELASS